MYNIVLLFKKMVKVVNIATEGVICMKVCFCTLLHLASYILFLGVSSSCLSFFGSCCFIL
jgi:hypothetical protein